MWIRSSLCANPPLFINKHLVQCVLFCSKSEYLDTVRAKKKKSTFWTLYKHGTKKPASEINLNIMSSGKEPVRESPTTHFKPWLLEAVSTWDLQDQALSRIHSYQTYSEGLSARQRGMQRFYNRAIALGTSTEAASKGRAFTLNQAPLPLDQMNFPKLHCANVSLWFLKSLALVLVPPVKPLQTAFAMAYPFVL